MDTTLNEAVKEKLKELTYITDDGCKIWQGTMQDGNPWISVERGGIRKRFNIRRLAGIKKYKLPLDTRTRFKTTCGNPRCYASEHLELVEITRKSRLRKGTSRSNIENNKAVFKHMVHSGINSLDVEAMGITVSHARNILKNTAMLPYFHHELSLHLLPEKIEDLKNLDLKPKEFREKFNISLFAYNYIQAGDYYPVKEIELFMDLLDNCEVLGSHLVWNGEYHSGTPVYKWTDKRYHSVLRMFMYATFGLNAYSDYELTCTEKNCVNPYHTTDAKGIKLKLKET